MAWNFVKMESNQYPDSRIDIHVVIHKPQLHVLDITGYQSQFSFQHLLFSH